MKSNNLTYVNDSLFNAPKGSILMHTCNTKGVWGAGIAKQFAERFPEAYEPNKKYCSEEENGLLGVCKLIPVKDYTIACLFTSEGSGREVDSPKDIIKNTHTALLDMVIQNMDNKPYHTCKINSGLFNVPWVESEKLLIDTGLSFTVYEYEKYK